MTVTVVFRLKLPTSLSRSQGKGRSYLLGPVTDTMPEIRAIQNLLLRTSRLDVTEEAADA